MESDFRLVAATHRNLEKMVEEGSFRRDLLYRLGAMVIELPPLRERNADMLELSDSILKSICRQYKIPTKTLSGEVLEAFKGYDWPGNIRELGNVLESAAASAYDMSEVYAHNLPERMRITMLKHSIARSEEAGSPRSALLTDDEFEAATDLAGGMASYKDFRQEVLATAEQRYFSRLMAVCAWDMKRACDLSGLGKSRLYSQLKKYRLDKE